jgi:hypothetical protein
MLAGLLVLGAYGLAGLRELRTVLIPPSVKLENHMMDAKTTTWQWQPEPGACATDSVTTNKHPNETDEQWCARHDARVAHGMAAHPPK